MDIESLDNNITNLPFEELRHKWSDLWGMKPHPRIGRKMLEESIKYKLREQDGFGLNKSQREWLEQQVKNYKRNPKCFDEHQPDIKPGTQIVREYKSAQHVATVTNVGFKYKNKDYTSLSQIASEITHTRRNGWEFFNLKRKDKANVSK